MADERTGEPQRLATILNATPPPKAGSPEKPWLARVPDGRWAIVDEQAYYAAIRTHHPTIAGGMSYEAVAGADGECRWCLGAGFVLKREGIGEQRVLPCGRCAAQRKQRHWEALGLRVVVRFADWQDDLQPEMQVARAACAALLAGKRWCIFLSAGTGRGKTHLAIATLVEWVETGHGSAYFRTVPEMLDELRDSYDAASAMSLNERLHFYETRDLLVLDDLGAEKATEWVAEKLFRIIDVRSQTEKPTFVTTNVSPSSPTIPARVRSRLACGEISVAGGFDIRRRSSKCVAGMDERARAG